MSVIFDSTSAPAPTLSFRFKVVEEPPSKVPETVTESPDLTYFSSFVESFTDGALSSAPTYVVRTCLYTDSGVSFLVSSTVIRTS
mgnify:CR=1 FL=1